MSYCLLSLQHLQLCGNPIANDPFYGGDLYFLRPHVLPEAQRAFRLMRKLNITPLSKLPEGLEVLNNSEEEEEEELECLKDENGQNWVEEDSEEANLIRNCK